MIDQLTPASEPDLFGGIDECTIEAATPLPPGLAPRIASWPSLCSTLEARAQRLALVAGAEGPATYLKAALAVDLAVDIAACAEAAHAYGMVVIDRSALCGQVRNDMATGGTFDPAALLRTLAADLQTRPDDLRQCAAGLLHRFAGNGKRMRDQGGPVVVWRAMQIAPAPFLYFFRWSALTLGFDRERLPISLAPPGCTPAAFTDAPAARMRRASTGAASATNPTDELVLAGDLAAALRVFVQVHHVPPKPIVYTAELLGLTPTPWTAVEERESASLPPLWDGLEALYRVRGVPNAWKRAFARVRRATRSAVAPLLLDPHLDLHPSLAERVGFHQSLTRVTEGRATLDACVRELQRLRQSPVATADAP